MSVIHILGAGQWQLPTILKAKELGFKVLLTDVYDSRPGYHHCDYHEVVDIRDKETTLRISRLYNICGIICDTTDVGVPTMAYVTEKLELGGISYSTALNCTNKYRQREILRKYNIRHPEFSRVHTLFDVHDFIKKNGLPVVIKPADSQSARGVSIINNINQIDQGFNKALSNSQSKDVIVETFLSGKEISVEGYVVNGKLTIAAIGDKSHFAELPTIASQITYPAILSYHTMNMINDDQLRLVSAVGLTTGIFHSEYMVVNETPYLIEMAARGGGSRIYTDICPALYNYDIVTSYIKYVVSGVWDLGIPISTNPPRAANLIFFQFRPGSIPAKLEGLDWARTIPNVKWIDIELEIGKIIPEIDSGRSRHGYALIFGHSREEVVKIAEDIYRKVYIITADGMTIRGN